MKKFFFFFAVIISFSATKDGMNEWNVNCENCRFALVEKWKKNHTQNGFAIRWHVFGDWGAGKSLRQPILSDQVFPTNSWHFFQKVFSFKGASDKSWRWNRIIKWQSSLFWAYNKQWWQIKWIVFKSTWPWPKHASTSWLSATIFSTTFSPSFNTSEPATAAATGRKSPLISFAD